MTVYQLFVLENGNWKEVAKHNSMEECAKAGDKLVEKDPDVAYKCVESLKEQTK
jgi:hypothetical protein